MKSNRIFDELCQLLHHADDKELKTYVGPVLKKLRINQGWKIQEVAKNYGINQATLSRVENSLIKPQKDQFFKYFDDLGFDYDDLNYVIEYKQIEDDFIDLLLELKETLFLDDYGLPKQHYFKDLYEFYLAYIKGSYSLTQRDIDEMSQLIKGSTKRSTQLFLLMLSKYYLKHNEPLFSARILDYLVKHQGLSFKQLLYIDMIKLELCFFIKNDTLAYIKLNRVNASLLKLGLVEKQTEMTLKYLNAVFLWISEEQLKEYDYGSLKETVKKLLLYKKAFYQQLSPNEINEISRNKDLVHPYLVYLEKQGEINQIKSILTTMKIESVSLFDHCIIDYFISFYIKEDHLWFYKELFMQKHKYSICFQTSFFLIEKFKVIIKEQESYKKSHQLIHNNYQYFYELEMLLRESKFNHH